MQVDRHYSNWVSWNASGTLLKTLLYTLWGYKSRPTNIKGTLGVPQHPRMSPLATHIIFCSATKCWQPKCSRHPLHIHRLHPGRNLYRQSMHRQVLNWCHYVVLRVAKFGSAKRAILGTGIWRPSMLTC